MRILMHGNGLPLPMWICLIIAVICGGQLIKRWDYFETNTPKIILGVITAISIIIIIICAAMGMDRY